MQIAKNLLSQEMKKKNMLLVTPDKWYKLDI